MRKILMHSKLKIQTAFIMVFVLSFILSGSALAKPEHGKKFKDWTVACEKLPTSGKEICNLFQNVTNDKGKVVMQVAVGYPPGKDTPQALITLPLGVMLPSGLEFKGGTAKAIRVPFTVCVKNGCVAGVELKPEIIKGMKAGEKGSVKFAASAKQVIEVPVSLKGFTAGFKSLK